MSATALPAHPGALPSLLRWLEDHAIEHDIHDHPKAFTARQTAQAEGVDPRTFAKVVGLRVDDGRAVMVVVDATDQLDLEKARRALDATTVRLLEEAEMVELAPDCEAGAMPAVGPLFGLPMLADHAVREDAAISFNAGTHRCSVRVDRAAWERATAVRYDDLAAADDLTPAWARS